MYIYIHKVETKIYNDTAKIDDDETAAATHEGARAALSHHIKHIIIRNMQNTQHTSQHNLTTYTHTHTARTHSIARLNSCSAYRTHNIYSIYIFMWCVLGNSFAIAVAKCGRCHFSNSLEMIHTHACRVCLYMGYFHSNAYIYSSAIRTCVCVVDFMLRFAFE